MRKSNSVKALFFAAILLLAVTPMAALAADHATVTPTNMPTCMTPGETKNVSVSVLNDGDAVWAAGEYRVSYHWEGPMNVWDGIRTDLPGAGNPQIVNAQLMAANHQTATNLPVGTYTLKWQVIHTGTGWVPVENSYSVEVKASCAPPVVVEKATITSANTPTCMTPGETKSVSVSVLNEGDTTWTAGTYRLSYHWEGPMNVWDGIRSDITGSLSKGNSQVVSAQLQAANHQTATNLPVGTYTLKWQVIHTGTGWIPDEKAYSIEVKASCSQPPGNPPLPQDYALIVVWNMPSCIKPGETKTIPVQVTNGGRPWSSSPKTGVKGCTNADKCPVRLSYRLKGPAKVESGLRTDLPDMPPGDTQTVDAKLKASDILGAPLAEGTYTVDWQVVREHMDWFPDKTSKTIEVTKSCGAKSGIAELCKKINCTKRMDVPHISAASPSPFTQGSLLIITGRDFGDQPGKVTMKGAFTTSAGGQFKVIGRKVIDLPLIGNTWHDTMIPVGISPDLVGLDQEVVIQVNTKEGKLSNEFKAAFNSQKDVRMVPRSEIDASGCSQVTNQQLPASRMTHCCNSSGDHACTRYVTNTVSAEHVGGSQPSIAVDTYRFHLNKGWKYHSMEGGYYWGTLTKFAPPAGGGDCLFSVSWQPGRIGADEYDHPIFGIGYWMNIYVEGPVGTEP